MSPFKKSIPGGCLIVLHVKHHDTVKMRNLFSVQTTSKNRSMSPQAHLPLQLYRQNIFIVTKIAHK